jgi:hypothetical protein
MFEQILAAMQKPAAPAASTTQSGLDYAQQMMQITLQLSQAQMEVMKGLYEEVGKEYRQVLAAADPKGIAQQGPGLMATTLRANAQAGALFMKNAKEYQEAILGLAQFTGPVFPATIMQDMMAMASATTAPMVNLANMVNGGAALPAARTKKADKAA